MHRNGTKTSGDGADAVGHTHQDTGVLWSNVQVVNVEPGNGKTAKSHPQAERDDGRRGILAIGHDEKERSLHTEATAVEDLTHLGRVQNAFLPKMVGQDTAARHHYRHQQMWKRAKERVLKSNNLQNATDGSRLVHLFDLEGIDVFEVRGLKQHQQVKVPRSAEVSDKYRVDGHRGEEGSPRGVRDGRDGVGLPFFPERVLYVHQLPGLDRRMLARLLEHQPQPAQVPHYSHDAVKIERSLPSYSFNQFSAYGHCEHDSGVATAESERGQSRPF